MISDESANLPTFSTQPAAPFPVRAIALAAYVALSSVLGLGPGIVLLLSEHDSPLSVFLNIWRGSLLADGVFLGGSIAVAVLSCRFITSRPVLAIAAGYFLTILVYSLAFASLYSPSDVSNFLGTINFVFFYGQLGLLFTAVAPLSWRLASANRKWRPESHQTPRLQPDGFSEIEDRGLQYEEARDWTIGPAGEWRI